MSVQAMAWVLDEAPGLPPNLLGTLMSLANHADSHGRNAWPSQETIARQARKSGRSVRKDLIALEELGLIQRGDQRIVMHIRPDRQPVVWDLPVTAGTARPAADDRSLTTGRERSNDRNSRAERPELQGKTTGTVVPTNRKEPKPEPSGTENPSARTPKATRLPDHFDVTPEMRAWAEREIPDLLAIPGRARREHDSFCDYWRAAAGAKARKIDWVATWRNWMRRAASDLNVRRAARSPTVGDRAHAAIEAGRRLQALADRETG